MPIKVTAAQLANAVRTGALDRFFSIGKALPAWFANRGLKAAVAIELEHLNEARDALLSRFGGTPPALGSEHRDAFETDAKALDALVIELPGEPVSPSAMLTGALSENDEEPLAPFLALG